MECAYHPDREPVGMCIACGKFICSECKAALGGKLYCTPCADRIFVQGKPEITKVEQVKAIPTQQLKAESKTGRAATEEPPIIKSSDKFEERPTMWKKLGLSRGMLFIWIGLLVVAAIAGSITGVIDGSKIALNYPSSDQLEVTSKQGKPPIWLLTDGPVKPGGEIHRVELWLYPGIKTQFNFIDGKLLEKVNVSSSAPVKASSSISSSTLSREMTLDRLRQFLGEDGKPTDTYKSKIYPGSQAYHFPKSRLLVSFLNGKLFTAQAY